MIVANFTDTSLLDVRKKGVFESVARIYNPDGRHETVLLFTPHAADLELAPDLALNGIEVIPHSVSGLQPIKILRAFFEIPGILRSRRVDIVRGCLPYLGSLLGVVIARLVGIPSVVSLGGDNRIVQARNGDWYLGSKHLSHAVEWLTLRLANRVTVPNRFTEEYVASIIGRPRAERKCVVIPWISPPVPASDPADSECLRQLGITPDLAVVPIVGFVNRYKFSDVLFDALEAGDFKDSHGRIVTFCFVGDGPLRADGEARFADRPDVRFLGWCDQRVVRVLLRRSDLVLIPMSGYVLLEAASLAKPIVASRVEWHSEVIRDGETGYLVDPDCPRDWRGAISRALAENPDRRRQMAKRLSARYETKLTPEVAIAREAALYEAMTSGTVRPT